MKMERKQRNTDNKQEWLSSISLLLHCQNRSSMLQFAIGFVITAEAENWWFLMFYSELSNIRYQSGSFFIVWGVLSLPGHYPFLSSFSDIYIWRLVPKTSRINNCGSVQCRDVWWRRWLIWKRERLFVKPSRWRHPFKPWRRRNRWVMDTLDWVCKSEYNYLLSCCCISRMLYERVDVQDQKDATCSTHAHTHTRSHAHNTQMDLF